VLMGALNPNALGLRQKKRKEGSRSDKGESQRGVNMRREKREE
jgi:hypothetical protein